MDKNPCVREDLCPLDISVMREAVRRLLANAEPLGGDELGTLTLQLREHLQMLIPHVESMARGFHRDSIPRYGALACVDVARTRLASRPCRRFGDDIGHARRLARALHSLCEQHAELQRTAFVTTPLHPCRYCGEVITDLVEAVFLGPREESQSGRGDSKHWAYGDHADLFGQNTACDSIVARILLAQVFPPQEASSQRTAT